MSDDALVRLMRAGSAVGSFPGDRNRSVHVRIIFSEFANFSCVLCLCFVASASILSMISSTIFGVNDTH